VSQHCQPLDYIGRFVSFQDGILCQSLDFLWGQGLVVDTDIVNQAGPKTTSAEILLIIETIGAYNW